MKHLIHRSLFLCLVLVTVAGCGKKTLTKKKTYSVSGKVLLDGEPVRFSLLEITPTGEEGLAGTGKTDGEGNFTLRTFSNNEPDGAVPGEYKLVVLPYDAARYGGLPDGGKPTHLQGKKPTATIEVKAEENDLGEVKVD